MTLTPMFIITVLAAGFALFDGINRLRGRGTNILAIAEIVVAILMLISIFVSIPGIAGTLVLAIILEIILLVSLFVRGGRGVSIVAIVALVLTTIVVVVGLNWVTIPALQG